MAARRWDLVVFGVLLVSPALVVLAVAASRQRTAPFEERLLAALAARAEKTATRPLHRGPRLRGSFGDGLVARLASLSALQKKVGDDLLAPELEEVFAGERAIRDLPASWLSALDAGAPDVDGVWAGARASADLGDARAQLLSPEQANWHGLRFFSKLAGLRVMQRLGEGNYPAALDACVDTLAVGRDAALLGGMPGLWEGLRSQQAMMGPCLVALDLAPSPEKRRALASIAKIRTGMPRYGPVLVDGLIDLEVLAFAEVIDPAALARLPEAVRPWGVVTSNTVPLIALRDGWAGTRESFDACLPLAELDHADRERALAKLDRDTLRKNINPMVSVSLAGASGLVRHADALESGLAILDGLLIAGAADDLRATEGRWPGSLEAVIHTRLTGKESPAEFMGNPELTPDEDSLQILVHVRERQPSGGEFAPSTITFVVQEDPKPQLRRRSKP